MSIETRTPQLMSLKGGSPQTTVHGRFHSNYTVQKNCIANLVTTTSN